MHIYPVCRSFYPVFSSCNKLNFNNNATGEREHHGGAAHGAEHKVEGHGTQHKEEVGAEKKVEAAAQH